MKRVMMAPFRVIKSTDMGKYLRSEVQITSAEVAGRFPHTVAVGRHDVS